MELACEAVSCSSCTSCSSSPSNSIEESEEFDDSTNSALFAGFLVLPAWELVVFLADFLADLEVLEALELLALALTLARVLVFFSAGVFGIVEGGVAGTGGVSRFAVFDLGVVALDAWESASPSSSISTSIGFALLSLCNTSCLCAIPPAIN